MHFFRLCSVKRICLPGVAFEAIKKIGLGKGGLFKVPRFFWHTCEYGHSVYSVWFSGTGGGSNTWSLCFSSNSQLCAAKSCGFVSRDTVRSWGGHALMEQAGCTPLLVTGMLVPSWQKGWRGSTSACIRLYQGRFTNMIFNIGWTCFCALSRHEPRSSNYVFPPMS